jgi:hypothetical protein
MTVIENVMQNSVQQSTEELLEILRDGDVCDGSQFQLATSDTQTDAEDYTVEIKIDLDSYVEDSSTIRGCHKMCRLCAHLVYEYKLISIFSPDKTKCLASKINRLLPEKVSNVVEYSGYIGLAAVVGGFCTAPDVCCFHHHCHHHCHHHHHPFVCPSIHPSIHPFIHPSVHPSVCHSNENGFHLNAWGVLTVSIFFK